MLNNTISSDLKFHWLVVCLFFCLLLSYQFICYFFGAEIQLVELTEEQRILIRSIFYVIAIIVFPLVNLLRHILLHLNVTMKTDTPAKNRYFITVAVCLFSVETIGALGFILFLLGDTSNSLYIFSLLGVLGLFIHRPKQAEYQHIINQLES